MTETPGIFGSLWHSISSNREAPSQDITPVYNNPEPKNVLLKDPVLYSNNMTDIPIDEELFDDARQSMKEYLMKLNQRGLILDANGDVIPVPKFVEPTSVKRNRDLIESLRVKLLQYESTRSMENVKNRLDDAVKLESMHQLIQLLNLTFSNSDEQVLDYYFNSRGDVPVICKSRVSHSPWTHRNDVQRCRFSHPDFCRHCTEVCPICFYQQLKEEQSKPIVDVTSTLRTEDELEEIEAKPELVYANIVMKLHAKEVEEKSKPLDINVDAQELISQLKSEKESEKIPE